MHGMPGLVHDLHITFQRATALADEQQGGHTWSCYREGVGATRTQRRGHVHAPLRRVEQCAYSTGVRGSQPAHRIGGGIAHLLKGEDRRYEACIGQAEIPDLRVGHAHMLGMPQKLVLVGTALRSMALHGGQGGLYRVRVQAHAAVAVLGGAAIPLQLRGAIVDLHQRQQRAGHGLALRCHALPVALPAGLAQHTVRVP